MRSIGQPQEWDPEIIDQAIPLLPEASESRTRGDVSEEPPVRLGEEALKVWRGEKPKAKDTGELDRSASLVKIGRVLFDAGANRMVIVAALEERDEALGYRKYTGRSDSEERYHEIVDELEANGRTTRFRIRPSQSLSGEESPSTNGDGTVDSFGRHNLTDLGNSGRFVAENGENVRYCFPWRKWLVWTGSRWKPDDTGKVHRLAKQTVRGIYREAAAAESEERRKSLAQHAARSESESRIKAMLELAKSEVPVVPSELDTDPWLFNAKNGTVDLRTGGLREPRREDLITKVAGAEYDPHAAAPVWESTIERVLPNQETREFFKRLCGYALTGDTSEHVLPMPFGSGANGKSTVLNAMLDAAGDYGMQAPPDLLIAKKNAHPTEIADLFGMRLVVSIEVEDGQRLAESLVKQMTGGDRMKGRRMRQDFWEFEPTHKPFMAVNHKPVVRGMDVGIWRRIRLIPFTETIAPEEQDKKLPAKLRKELSGILAWAVEGCLQWQDRGLQAPEEVRKATGEYRSEMDILGAFLKECCQQDPDSTVGVQDVYKAYKVWCEESGERSEGKRKFSGRLKDRGFESRRSGPNGSYEWHGLKLLNFWKAAVCRETEVTEPKVPINSRKSESRGVIGALSSESSGSSVGIEKEVPVSYDLQPSEAATVEEPRERRRRLSEEETQEVQKLVAQGMSARLARAAVLGEEA